MRKNNILSFFATQIRNFESKAEEILTPCFRLENQIYYYSILLLWYTVYQAFTDLIFQALVVQRLDKAIHWINHYLKDSVIHQKKTWARITQDSSTEFWQLL